MSSFSDREVRDYLVSKFAKAFQTLGVDPKEVSDDFDFLKEGILDSLGLLELMADVEAHFGHTIDLEELDAEQMTVLGPLSAYIQRKLWEARESERKDVL
jgi:acyl carrier protein